LLPQRNSALWSDLVCVMRRTTQISATGWVGMAAGKPAVEAGGTAKPAR